MKVERLISILMLLLNKRKLTAKELSDYFEVSVRTIQRDMDTLCNAGIPIYGDVGKYGGYKLTENYKLNRSFLTLKEMDTLVVMLRGFKDTLYTDSIRTIEPYTILLKSNSWYIYGYCLLRDEYRMFKITRIFDLEILINPFVPRDDVLEPHLIGNIDNNRENTTFKIKFSSHLRGQIPDYFNPDKSIEEDDGSIVHISSFPVDEWMKKVPDRVWNQSCRTSSVGNCKK